MTESTNIIPVKPRKLEGIQILRGIAAAMVVFCHVVNAVYNYDHGQSLLAKKQFILWGTSGVDIFFVISGFIIYITTVNKNRQADSAPAFMLKRALRIYPLYWLFTTVYVLLILSGLAFRSNPITPLYTISSYLLIPADKPGHHGFIHPIVSQGWTLAYELYFYLIFSLGILLKQKKHFILYLCISLSVLAGLALSFKSVYLPVTGLISSPLIMEFVLGVLLARLFLHLQKSQLLFKSNYLCALLIAIALLALYFEPVNVSRVAYRAPLAGLMLLTAAMLCPVRSAVNRYLIYLGDASYSVYLTHGLFSLAIGTLLKKGWLGMIDPSLIILLFTAIAIIGGVLVYTWIEKPLMIRLKRSTLK
ncbi:acyltransferase [Mucilaginibacter gynuensis]|uniref:Acyltransferase n=1 Tax=Mucilaginibacter gynuensis TaxID=1302236 RepID=A0ABP8GZ58_9SPHI